MIELGDEVEDDTFETNVDDVNIGLDNKKFSTLDGTAEMLVSDDNIQITNQGNGYIACSYGNIIKGSTHLTETPSNIRINGFWVLNDELLTTLPSTIYTPIPVLVYKESPYVKMAQGIIKSLNVT